MALFDDHAGGRGSLHGRIGGLGLPVDLHSGSLILVAIGGPDCLGSRLVGALRDKSHECYCDGDLPAHRGSVRPGSEGLTYCRARTTAAPIRVAIGYSVRD